MNETKESKMKTIEERIENNIRYQTTAEHLKDKPIDQIKSEAEIIGIVGYISEYIQWDPKRAINIAEGLLEDVNLHDYQVINGKDYEITKKESQYTEYAVDNIEDKIENDNKADFEAELNQFIGTTQYYPSSFGKLNLTDGVQYLREKGNCYWFIDIIESYQPKLRNVGFQIWGISVNEDKTATVYCKEDTNRKPLITQKLEYADFPLDDFELYCIDDVVLLKSEY
jgi:hypothetical protein